MKRIIGDIFAIGLAACVAFAILRYDFQKATPKPLVEIHVHVPR